MSWEYAEEVKNLVDAGVELAIVIGDTFRGVAGAAKVWIECKVIIWEMLATVINGMALQGAFEDQGIKTRLQSANRDGQSSRAFSQKKSSKTLGKKEEW